MRHHFLLLLGLLSLPLADVMAQPTVTGRAPARHVNNAPLNSDVVLTFSGSFPVGTASSLRVHSAQREGRKAGATGGGGSNTLTFNPTVDFKPGETVSVTVPASIAGAAGKEVYQFTTAVGGTGRGFFTAGSEVPMGNQPSDAKLGDVDGDGDLDMLVGNYLGNSVFVRLNDGAGNFSGSQNLTVAANPSVMQTADLDNDGDLDLVCGNVTANLVSVLLNDGAGTFSAGTNFSAGNGTYNVATGDVDADGDLDLVAANYSSSTVSVQLNNGAGTFSAAQSFPISTAYGIVLGDVDADGDLDILVTTFGGNTVNVRINDGTGTFSGSQAVTVGSSPVNIVTGDVDGDGDLDFATANLTSGSVSIRVNNGTGTFSGTTNLPISIPYGVSLGDVDADGDLDAVASAHSSDVVRTWHNNGVGTFSPGLNTAVGDGPYNVALGDVDGDGDLDFVTPNQQGGTVSVRLNQPTTAVASIVRTGGAPAPTNAASVSYTVTFTDPVSGLSASNFSLTSTGTLAGTSVISVSGSGTTYTVTVGTGTGEGALRLDLANGTGASVPVTNAPFTGGESYTLDRTAPTVTITSPASPSTGTSPITVDITFSEPVTNFSLPEVLIANGMAGALALVTAQLYRVDITPTGPGTVTVDVAANAAQDAAGNGNTVAPQFSITYAPTLAPTALGLSPQSVTENTAAGAAIGNFSTTDPNAGDTHTYTLVSGAGSTDNAAFSINGSGQLVITAAPNYEAQPSYAIRVRTTDQGGLFFEQTFTISVLDVVEDLLVDSPQTILGGTYNNVTVTGTGQGTLGGNVLVEGLLLIQSGGSLDDGCFVITGPGNFVLAAGGTLAICSQSGITASGPQGTVQVTGTRTYSRAASYIYDSPSNGSGVSTGNGLPDRVRDLTIATPITNVLLSSATSVRRMLSFTGTTSLNTGGRALTLLSDADSTALVVNAGTGRVLGTTTVQRYISPGSNARLGYRHLSSPVTNSTVADLTVPGPGGFTPKVNAAYNAIPAPALPAKQMPTVFGFDETRGGPTAAFEVGYYSPTSLTDALASGRGYTAYMTGGLTPDFVGTLHNGDRTLTGLTRTGTNLASTAKPGWHLFGNPFPSPIDWDLVQVPADMSSSISVFKSTGANSGVYLTRVSNGDGTGTGTLPNGLVPMGQAFFGRVTGTGPVDFTFTNAMRVTTYDNPTHFRVAPATQPLVRLALRQAGEPNPEAQGTAQVYFAPDATPGIDNAYDGAAPARNLGVPTLTSIAEAAEELAVNGLPLASLAAGTTVELLLDLPAAGAYQLSVAALANLTGTAVALLDRLTGTRYVLGEQSAIRFKVAQAGEVRGRFALQFGPANGVMGLGAAAEQLVLAVYPNPATGGQVRVSGLGTARAVQLLDAVGRMVRQAAVATSTHEVALTLTGLPAGMYTVRAGARSQRLMIE